MTIKNLDDLYSIYKEKRNLTISKEQFILFAEFFPVILVVTADGVVDEEEEIYINKLSNSLGNIFKEEGLSDVKVLELKKVFKEEFAFLIFNLDDWQDAFLDGLKGHLEHNPDQKEAIIDTVYLFAEASAGISDDEERMLTYIKKRLDLKEDF